MGYPGRIEPQREQGSHFIEMTKKAMIGSSTRWTILTELRHLGVKIIMRARASGGQG
jgi:hypothetical protein